MRSGAFDIFLGLALGLLLALVLWVLLHVTGCQPAPQPTPPEPKPASGCAAACDNAGKKLHCDGWQDEDGGETCPQKCEGVRAAGIPLDTDCVRDSPNCSDVDGC